MNHGAPYGQYPPPYGPPSQGHYQQPGFPPNVPQPPPEPQASRFGDNAGEHLVMTRGRYSAWPYVVIAFLMQIAIVGGGPALALGFTADAIGLADEAIAGIAIGVLLVVGIAGAIFTFRDRWRCNEAFSSRFCSGLMNLSLLYVPIIALVYANVRGAQKLMGK